MRRLHALTALCLGVLLFAAPAAWACAEHMAMTSDCTMEMEESAGDSACHDTGQLSMDCCLVQSAPPPASALSLKDVTAFTVVSIPVVESPPPAPRLSSKPDSSASLPDLARYSLFSSYLL